MKKQGFTAGLAATDKAANILLARLLRTSLRAQGFDVNTVTGDADGVHIIGTAETRYTEGERYVTGIDAIDAEQPERPVIAPTEMDNLAAALSKKLGQTLAVRAGDVAELDRTRLTHTYKRDNGMQQETFPAGNDVHIAQSFAIDLTSEQAATLTTEAALKRLGGKPGKGTSASR